MSNLKTLKEIFAQPTRPNKLYCNVPGVYFIWHGSWNDPEVMYQDKLFNLPTDIETPLYVYYCDDCKAKGIEEDEDDFVEVTCPNCGEEVCFDSDILYDEDLIEVTCPACGAVVFVNGDEDADDLDDEEDEDEE